MEKLCKGFFEGEVLICGCIKEDNLFYRKLRKEFEENGVRVFPMPTTPISELGFDTYDSFDKLPKVPNSAFVLSPKKDTPAIIEQLSALGVKKVAFFGRGCADDAILADCTQRGIQTVMGCPRMLFGGGLHRLHGILAGVKRA